MTSSNPNPLLSPLPSVPQVPLTLFSVLTPGNTPGEPVTPHWVLDAQPWRMVTLEEPVSAVSSLPLWEPRVSQALCPFPNFIGTIWLGSLDSPLPQFFRSLPEGLTGQHLARMSLHTWKSFSGFLPSFPPFPEISAPPPHAIRQRWGLSL